MKQTQEEVSLDARFAETRKEDSEDLEGVLQDMENRFYKLKGIDPGRVFI